MAKEEAQMLRLRAIDRARPIFPSRRTFASKQEGNEFVRHRRR